MGSRSTRIGESAEYVLRIISNRTQQRFGRPSWFASSLFPVPQRADFDTQQRGEIGLAQPRLGAQRLYVVRDATTTKRVRLCPFERGDLGLRQLRPCRN